MIPAEVSARLVQPLSVHEHGFARFGGYQSRSHRMPRIYERHSVYSAFADKIYYVPVAGVVFADRVSRAFCDHGYGGVVAVTDDLRVFGKSVLSRAETSEQFIRFFYPRHQRTAGNSLYRPHIHKKLLVFVKCCTDNIFYVNIII